MSAPVASIRREALRVAPLWPILEGETDDAVLEVGAVI